MVTAGASETAPADNVVGPQSNETQWPAPGGLVPEVPASDPACFRARGAENSVAGQTAYALLRRRRLMRRGKRPHTAHGRHEPQGTPRPWRDSTGAVWE